MQQRGLQGRQEFGSQTGTICRPQQVGGAWLARCVAAPSEHLDLLLIEQPGTRKTT